MSEAGQDLALIKALVARLRTDAGVQALLGDPARVWDAAPEGAGYPHLLLRQGRSGPLRADGGGEEHRLTLTCVSRFNGSEEARAVVAAVRAALADVMLEADGVRASILSTGFADIYPASGKRRTTLGVLAVRAVTEAV